MSEIKIEIKAELSGASISSMQNQLKKVSESNTIKPNVDGDSLATGLKKGWDSGKKKVEGDKIKPQVDTASFNKNLGEATSQMQGLYDKSKVTKVSMKDMGDGMYSVTAKIQEADGSMKSVVHTYDSATNSVKKQADAVNGVNNGIQETGKLTERQASNLLKVQAVERDINKLKAESRGLDPKSEKYKEVTTKIEELETKTKEWNKSLDTVSKVDFNNMKTSINETRESMSKNIEIEKAHAEALKENAKIDAQVARERTKLAKQQSVDWKQVGSDVGSAGREILKLSAPLVAAGGIAIKSAIQYESAFAGVGFSCPLC